jgi:hypothetical protein
MDKLEAKGFIKRRENTVPGDLLVDIVNFAELEQEAR